MSAQTTHMKPAAPATGALAILVWLGGAAPALAVPGNARCSATITASFADSCRDFTSDSSKDISYVKLHYADGRVVKRERINRRHYAIDGGPGGEIDFATVKSGTTIEEFTCEPANTAPTARLEIHTPPVDQVSGHCYDFFTGSGGGLVCEQSSLRTVWTSASEIPDNGFEGNLLLWGCGGLSHPSLCSWTISFRGTGSSDPDGDIASWSLDFGDGTSASGTWSVPPAEVTHEYSPASTNCTNGICAITLTVTDTAGQSHSDTMLMIFLDQSPD